MRGAARPGRRHDVAAGDGDVPLSGSIMRLIMRIVVVLPQPDGPISTQISPSPIGERQRVDRRRARAGEALRQVLDLDHAARNPAGVIAPLQAPEQHDRCPARAASRESRRRGAAGRAIIAMPAVMKSPRPPPPMIGGEHGAGDDLHGGSADAGEDHRQRERHARPSRTDLAARHSHAARRIDDVGIDLPRIAV